MTPRTRLTALALTCLSFGSITAESGAATTQINIPWLGLVGGDTSLTATGTGFLTAFSISYLDALSLDNAKSYLQVPMSLIGTEEQSAVLSITVGGTAVDNNLTVTLFDSGGTLGHHFTPPNVVATGTFSIAGGQTNLLDVSSLLATAKANNLTHFALHFNGTTTDIWSSPASAATVTLILNPVPEPSSVLLSGAGALGLLARRRRRVGA